MDGLSMEAAFDGLHRIHGKTDATNLGFRYAAIPDDFDSKADEVFDPEEMKPLFELGYWMGSTCSAWRDTPPGYCRNSDGLTLRPLPVFEYRYPFKDKKERSAARPAPSPGRSRTQAAPPA